MNQINELEHDQLLELIKFFICTSKGLRQKRLATNAALETVGRSSFDLLSLLAETPDPEFTKCVAAACLQVIFQKHDMTVAGVSDYKTAADARAVKPETKERWLQAIKDQ